MRTARTPAAPPAGTAGFASPERARTLAWPALAALVVLLAAGLRLYRLDAKSLWLDEIIQASAASYTNVHQVLAWTRGDDQMPMLNVLVFTMRGLHPQEWLLRFPSALAGILAVPVMYLLGKELVSRRVGVLAALLMAVAPFAISYSQEARPYALLILGTILQFYFALRVVRYGHILDGVGLGLASVFNLYTHYMAVAATAGAAVFVGGALIIAAVDRRSRSAWIGRASPALLSAVVILVGYYPWARTLRDFLRRGSQGFARYGSLSGPLRLSDITGLLGQFDLSGLILALLLIGVVACAVWAWRGRWMPVALLGAWLLVPIAGLTWRLHSSIVLLLPRYFSFLVPAALLLVAIGVDGLARLVGLAWSRWSAGRRRVPFGGGGAAPVVLGLLIAALGVQLIPAMVSAYQAPKDDYRDAAAYLAGASPADAVVLTVGHDYNFAAIGLKYYLGRLQSPILVADGSQLDDRTLARLRQSSMVWAAVFTSVADPKFAAASVSRLDVHRWPGITLVRSSTPASGEGQADQLLKWAMAFEPEVGASLDYIAASEPVNHPPSSPIDLWSSSQAMALTATGAAVDAMPATLRAQPGIALLFNFSYRNPNFQGDQRALIAARDATGQVFQFFTTADRYPLPNGYACGRATDWTDGHFAFTVPPGTASLTVWLRVTGTGVAEFRDLSLQVIG